MKKVFYTQRVESVPSYGEIRDCADQKITSYILECGYLPVPVPNNRNVAETMFREIRPDGIILTGGNSLVKYGGTAPERDATDCILMEMAIKSNLPLYGFCRGMQSILDYLGEDLTEMPGHVAVYHEVKGAINESVNSYHNQACVRLKNTDLTVLAQTADGVIEAVRHVRYPILATMWHPEREWPFRKTDIDRIRRLMTTHD